MLDEYEKYAQESAMKKTLRFTSPNDIYHSLVQQAEARVSMENGYNYTFLYFCIIKAFMYGYYSTHDESIVDRIVAELNAVYPKLFDLSVQEAIDLGYYDNVNV